MKRYLFTAWLSCFFSLSAWAANGTNLIGISPSSQALGGTGTAHYMTGTDALYKNPALLTAPEGEGKFTVDVFATYFNQKAKAQRTTPELIESKSGARILPQVGATYKMSDKLGLGLGVISFGGAIVDYTGEATLYQLKQELMLVRIIPAVGYKVLDNLSLGFAPLISYGALAINLHTPPDTGQTNRGTDGQLGFGVQAGATFKPCETVTLGAVFLSKTKYSYKGIIDLDRLGPMALTPASLTPAVVAADDLSVQQPQEFSLGVSWKAFTDFTFVFDYRHIEWSSADSYKELGWRDQHVIAIGAQYKIDRLSLRAGFNWARSVYGDDISENGGTAVPYQGHSIFQQYLSLLNIVAFPAVAQSHFTFGAGYALTDSLNVDAAFVYAPSVKSVRNGAGPGGGAYTYRNEVSQWSIAAGGTYKF